MSQHSNKLRTERTNLHLQACNFLYSKYKHDPINPNQTKTWFDIFFIWKINIQAT